MKRKLLTTLIFALGAFYASAQFTPGNLAVYRYGNGTAALANDVTVPVFIDEYTPAGVLVKSRAIPTTDIVTGSFTNLKLTGLGRDVNGKYVNEGISTLSQDGKYLTIFGYNQAVGGAVPTSANGLVVGVIAADESYNSTTTLSNDPTTGLGFPRSAVTDGTGIWANGSQNGIQYTTLGGTSSTRINTVGQQNASNSLIIAKTYSSGVLGANRLYVANGFGGTSFPFATPLPTTSTSFDVTGPFTSSITANQVAFVSVGTRTLIYVVDGASNSIRRYWLNSAGAALIFYGPSGSAGFTDGNFTNIKSITATYNSTLSTGTKAVVDVYVTTWGNDGTGTETSKLLTFQDAYTPGSTITTYGTGATATANQALLASTALVIKEAPANTLFKSVTFVPTGSTAIGTGTLPVNLTGFNGKKSGDNVILNWATLSEQNNSYFDVLRSGNGKDFSSIGKVTGNGNSNGKINYSFTDKTPEFGTNYYHLNQVDFDGKTTPSETVAVNFGFAENLTLSVSSSTDNSGLTAVINTPAIVNGKINVISISGQQVATVDVSLEKGKNYIDIPSKLQPGVYVITLSSDKGKISQKISLR
ncbi:hypothetical protein A5893_04910 [Pedobacter psychrophilus]|uniref:Secretion system C-terminal sorting domain-containing protein n=1 Tax=Pedobacter psychrophilus TaxID=1826909 RepID=A0A179DGT9_9SPHI|nr:T9SS type A sorting domain-containing protein [Pedobacter psychrophilus]OAQ40296.1 hypothetical protein A5893_04910 [Pedobacter psychrophilus]